MCFLLWYAALNPTPSYLRPLALALALLPLGGCRHRGFPVAPEGYREFAYVANTASNTVTILDLVYLRPDRTLSVGAAPTALAVNPRRDEVYVVNSQPDASTGTVSVLDTTRNVIVATIPVGRSPSSISVDPTGHLAYIANTASNSVTILDLDARRSIASFNTADKPSVAVLSPDGHSLVVTSRQNGSVAVFAAAAPGSATAPLTLRATFAGCTGATSPVILPDSSKAFIACSGGHQVMALWLASAANSWSARQDPSLTADHLLALLDVGSNPGFLSLKPDGGEVFASNLNSDDISEISTQTNEVGSTFPIGDHPAHGVVSADNAVLWVSNSGADSISLYSIEDGRFLASIRTGNAPDALAFSADQHLLLVADTRSGDVAVVRTTSRLGPAALFTLLPAGSTPAAIVVKAMQSSL